MSLLTQQFLVLLVSILPLSLIITIYLPGLLKNLPNKYSKTTIICTPIVGTFTKSPIEVRTIYFDKFKGRTEKDNNLVYLFNNHTQQEIRIEKRHLQKDPLINLIGTITTLCHHPNIKYLEDVVKNFLKNCAIDLKRIENEYQIIAKITGNEEKKFSSIVAINKTNKEIYSFSKGNAKKILERCTRLLIDNKKIEITPQIRHKLKKRIERLIKNGQKVIAFAYKPLPLKRLDSYSEQFTENDLVLISIMGLTETLNTELIPTIEAIKSLGIKIYILTDTKENKAVAVAEELKTIDPRYFESITGKYLENLNEQKLMKLLSNKEKDYVFSELTTIEKNRIIEALKKNGENITFSNPQKNISLGNILMAVKKSHDKPDNNSKIKLHALNCKIAEIILAIIALISQIPPAISLYLILTLDILVNLPLELSLKNCIHETKNLKSKIIINGSVTGFLLGSTYLWNMIRFGWYPGENFSNNNEAIISNNTLIFTALVLIQIIFAYQLKADDKNLLKNKVLLSLPRLLLTIIILLLTYLLDNPLNLIQINLKDLGVILFTVLIIFLIEEFRKFLNKKNEKEHISA